MPRTPEQAAEELFWRTCLPSRVAQYLGRKVMGREYKVYPWIAYIEQEIISMFQRPGREVLIVNISPQEGKTTFAGMWLPFWLVGQRPDDQGILVSYSDEYCLAPDTPVLTESLEYVPVGSLGVGDRLVGFDEDKGPGGGYCRRWRAAEVTATGRRVLPCYRVTLADGTETVCSENHQWLVSQRTHRRSWWVTAASLALRLQSPRNKRWQGYEAVRVMDTWSADDSRTAGYLAGMFDGEGWFSRERLSPSMGQLPGVVLDEVERGLKELGFNYTMRQQAQGSAVQSLTILGGKAEYLRFLGTVRPQRFIKKWIDAGGADVLGKLTKLAKVPIESVEFIGEQEVVTLATSTGTLVAQGYAHHNSTQWGLRVRNLVEQFGEELFGVGLSKSQATANNWKTHRGFGGMLSVGIGGGITGNPGHWILIDDVIKNMEEAGSPATKRKHLEEWDGSISARFQEDTKVVITATRWNEDDLSGEIIARAQAPEYEGVPVKVIRIKAIAEPDEEEELAMTPAQREQWRDVLGRRIGETLDGQHSRGFFLERRASVGPYVWNALYQASPSARKGSMFPMENWGWYDPDHRPTMAALRRSWDIAATEGGGDFTVGGHIGKAEDGRVYVLDVRRFRLSTSGVKDEIMRCAKTDGYGTRILMEQESAGAGKTVVGAYEHDLRAYDFEGVRPEGEKVSRYTNYSDLQQRGHVLLPRRSDGSSPDWVQPFIAEHKMQMPDGRGPRHDDQIDAVALAVNDLYDMGPIEILDPGDETTHYGPEDQVESFAHSHGVQLSAPMPDHLAEILGR